MKPSFLIHTILFWESALKSLVASIGYQVSRVAGVPHNFDARPFGENILPIAGTHDLHLKSGWLSSIECRSRRTILIANPRAMVAFRCYENCELPLAISRVHSEFQDKKRKEETRESARRNYNPQRQFRLAVSSARHKIVLQRGSFVTTENNEANEFDRMTAACDWKRSLFRDFVNTIFRGIPSTRSLSMYVIPIVFHLRQQIYTDLTQYLPSYNYSVIQFYPITENKKITILVTKSFLHISNFHINFESLYKYMYL